MTAKLVWATPDADRMIAEISEKWKPLPFDNGYLVSEFGQVFSTKSNRLLTPQISTHGYLYISTKTKGFRKNHPLHRIIMQLYGPQQPEGKSCINHIDGVKTNNDLSNLEWCNYSENSRHAIRVLGRPKPPSHLGRTGALSKLSKPIIAINIATGQKMHFESMRRADAIGFRIANVRASIAGKVNHYKGFKWTTL